MEDATMGFKDAGAQVIISSQTPSNPFRDHNEATPVYALYAKAVADKTGVTFVDHFSLTRDEYLDLGAVAVNDMLPSDGVHTTSAGAEVVARSFVGGVLCAGQVNPLYPYVTRMARLVSSFSVSDSHVSLKLPVMSPGHLETKWWSDLSTGIIPQPLKASECSPLFLYCSSSDCTCRIS